MSRRRIGLLLLVTTAIIAAACGGLGDEPRVFEPLHPDAAPLTVSEFEEALRTIIGDLDLSIQEARAPLDSARGIGNFLTAQAIVLPGIPSRFQKALEEIALLAPPLDWQHDHARFVTEHRDLLRKRVLLFGALATNANDLAASLASEIEERFAAMQAELEPRFLELTAAFFDPRRYGATLG